MPHYLTLRSAIALARVYATRRSGLGDGMQDFLAPKTEAEFEAAKRETERLLGQMQEHATRLVELHQGFEISPLHQALLDVTDRGDADADRQQAQVVVDSIQLFADSPWEDFVAAAKADKRGNKPSRNPELDAAVMAVMHYLHATGRSYRGGWQRVNKRVQVAASRTTDAEWTLSEPAKSIVAVLRLAGFVCDISKIRGSYDKYLCMLVGKDSPESERAEGKFARYPDFSDYLPDHNEVEYSFVQP